MFKHDRRIKTSCILETTQRRYVDIEKWKISALHNLISGVNVNFDDGNRICGNLCINIEYLDIALLQEGRAPKIWGAPEKFSISKRPKFYKKWTIQVLQQYFLTLYSTAQLIDFKQPNWNQLKLSYAKYFIHYCGKLRKCTKQKANPPMYEKYIHQEIFNECCESIKALTLFYSL